VFQFDDRLRLNHDIEFESVYCHLPMGQYTAGLAFSLESLALEFIEEATMIVLFVPSRAQFPVHTHQGPVDRIAQFPV
jgi:hypothetical protein